MWIEKLRFHDLIDRAADRWPQREALTFEGRRWSFAALRDEVDRAAKALIAAGVAPGDHVCLWLGNRPEHVFLFFAAASVGAVLVPIKASSRSPSATPGSGSRPRIRRLSSRNSARSAARMAVRRRARGSG